MKMVMDHEDNVDRGLDMGVESRNTDNPWEGNFEVVGADESAAGLKVEQFLVTV